jgi:hypothetical protein
VTFRIENGLGGQVRVIGSLEAPALELLREAISGGTASLDLSAVDRAEERAVRFLAALPEDRCALVGCPRWLSLWIEHVRKGPPPPPA